MEDDEDVSYYTDSKKKKTKEPKKSTYEDTLELWKQNLSIYEIAKHRKLTPQTIYNHFAKLIQMEIVQLSDILPEDKISDLRAAFKDFKGESLGELKEIHGDKFTWDELRLYKASFGQQNYPLRLSCCQASHTKFLQIIKVNITINSPQSCHAVKHPT